MKITKQQLKQIIREELQTVLSEVDKNFVFWLIKKAKPWLERIWTSEAIQESPGEAYYALMLEIKRHWEGAALLGMSQGQKDAMASFPVQALFTQLMERAKKSADTGVVASEAFDDLNYFVPDSKRLDSALKTGLGTEHLQDVAPGRVPWEDDDDL